MTTRCPQIGVRFEDEHMRTKSRGRSAPSLSHDRLVPPTMREDQRVCVRIWQQAVQKRVRNETRKLRVSVHIGLVVLNLFSTATQIVFKKSIATLYIYIVL